MNMNGRRRRRRREIQRRHWLARVEKNIKMPQFLSAKLQQQKKKEKKQLYTKVFEGDKEKIARQFQQIREHLILELVDTIRLAKNAELCSVCTGHPPGVGMGDSSRFPANSTTWEQHVTAKPYNMTQHTALIPDFNGSSVIKQVLLNELCQVNFNLL